MAIEKNEKGLYEVVIDDHTYEFQKWDADEAVRVVMRLAKIAGPTLAGFVASIVSGKQKPESTGIVDREIRVDLMQEAIGALFTNLDEDSTLALLKKFSSEKILCDGKTVTFKSHYQDRLMHLGKVVAAGLEVQYEAPFAAIKDLVERFRSRAKALTPAKAPSPGSSTG